MGETSSHVVIVGAGHAGGSCAALLRQYGWPGPITLIGAEPVAPYQRPPLSKAWLHGAADLATLLLRPSDFYAAHNVRLLLAAEATRIDRAAGYVMLATGERIAYDHLVLALGAHARSLRTPGHALDGVLALRTIADAERLKVGLGRGARVAIIGAGYIGLEVAASARLLGADVVVVERERRVLPRVASTVLSDYFQRRHAVNGVRIMLNAALEAIEGNGRVTALRLSDGTSIPCDVALAGIGAVPNDAMARAAGLDCDDGIIVDSAARTSDPAIHAIGDCTRRPLPLYGRNFRLESVPNALEQAKQAAADLCGRAPPAPEVPWFWSDQYDVRLQIAGLPFDVAETVVRGGGDSFAVFHMTAGGLVQAVEAVNAPADFVAGRMMVARRTRALAASLRDMSCSLRELVA